MIQEHIPYTYLIGWSKHNKFYYGVRYAKNCSPNDLWKTYFTSSNVVKRFRLINGDPDIIQIRKTFKTKDKAILWEHKVLKRMNVLKKSSMWLNKSIPNDKIVKILSDENFIIWNKGIPAWNRGIPHSEEQKTKQRQKMKNKYIGEKNPFFGKKHSEKSKEKNRLAHLAKKQSEETKLKKSIAGKLRKHTAESKEKMSLIKKEWHKKRKIEIGVSA